MVEWQQDALTMDKTGLMSRRSIAKTLKVRRSTCLDFLRKYDQVKNDDDAAPARVLDGGYDNSRILFLSDMHIPYHNKN